MKDYLTLAETSEIIGKSKETLRRWDNEGILNAVREPVSNYRVYRKSDVQALLGSLFDDLVIDEVSNFVEPENEYSVLELFAGAGGLAIGLEKAGLKCVALNEIDKSAKLCEITVRIGMLWKAILKILTSRNTKER